jgi:hypothetical protein
MQAEELYQHEEQEDVYRASRTEEVLFFLPQAHRSQRDKVG